LKKNKVKDEIFSIRIWLEFKINQMKELFVLEGRRITPFCNLLKVNVWIFSLMLLPWNNIWNNMAPLREFQYFFY